MKTKKIISLLITLIMLATICVAAIPTASAAGNPVALMYARGDIFGGGGFNAFANVYGFIEVENIAYNKSVTIHYSFDEITWKDASASYYKQTLNNNEAWEFSVDDTNYTGSTCTFAIKYEVGGQTYWDNNNGQNYKVSISGGTLGEDYAIGNAGLKVAYSSYRPLVYQGVFSGSIIVKNLAYQKSVKVRYTTDNWSSYTEASASYGRSLSNGLEVWAFSTSNIPADWSTLKYAVSYTVNGVTYWDNNFGENYTIDNYNI